ncbi:hypothetical protein [Bradyrhizobium sp. WSM3983]|uniref:hypothetical protein n=1 Tax=Bradyrhizobium sp. WSM3983 TaxID=1038867 RepID=UPI000417B98E|nr:hypothetical protein [Bradyrhizobium sp. WSM3983]
MTEIFEVGSVAPRKSRMVDPSMKARRQRGGIEHRRRDENATPSACLEKEPTASRESVGLSHMTAGGFRKGSA